MNSENKPSISVVVPCRNEARNLIDCLRSMLIQTHPPIEIIVVDDGSTDGSADLARRLDAESQIPILLCEGPHRGAAAARNTGAARATGELIVFIEADAYYSPEYLAGAVAAMSDPDVGGAEGGLRQAWVSGDTFLARGWNHIFRSRWERACTGERTPLGAWVFRARDFEKLGGYDESFVVGEDRDLVERIRSEGGRIAFFPEGVFHHREPVSLSDIWRRSYWGGRHSLPFRRRWSSVTRDIVVAIAVAVLPILFLGLVIGLPGWLSVAPFALLLLPLLIADLRGGIGQAFTQGDALGALAVAVVYLLSKLASAIGIVSGWLQGPKRTAP